MSKTTSIFVILLVAGILSFFIYNYLENQKKIDWTESFKETNGRERYKPYDLTLLRECLKGNDFKTENVSKKLSIALDSNLINTNYIFIGEALRADSTDYESLVKYIERGNDVFISSKYVASHLMRFFKKEVKKVEVQDAVPEENSEEDSEVVPDSLQNSINDEDIVIDSINNKLPKLRMYSDMGNGLSVFTDSIVSVALYSPDSLKYKTGYFNYLGKEKEAINWEHFNNDIYNELKYPTTEIGVVNSLTNCISISYGKGNLFLHSSPILFTNIEVLEENGKNYSKKIFSLLRKGNIFWDNYNRTNVWTAQMLDQSSQKNKSNKPEKTPLQYILTNPPLAWAWYSLLAMAVIFLIFTAKRRQRIVPVLAKNTNTSLAFIQTIGRMYFNKQDHSSLSQLQFKQWQWFVRERYGLITNKLDEDFIKKLAAKSNIKLATIEHLVKSGQYIESHFSGESSLIEFHKDLDKFYKSCK